MSSARPAPLAATVHRSNAPCSFEAKATRRPSGDQASADTALVWPDNCFTSWPVAVSQTAMRPSLDAEAKRRPSGEIATAVAPLVEEPGATRSRPVEVSQARVGAEILATTTVAPSRSKAKSQTQQS